MAWWLVLENQFPSYLGEAGNSSYSTEAQISAMRIGNEVLVQFPHHREKGKRCQSISADLIAKGFGDGIDGKSLRDIMAEGVHFNYALRPIQS